MQNILNKLGFENRVQIATWWAHEEDLPPQVIERVIEVSAPALPLPASGPRLAVPWSRALVGLWCAALLVAAATDGALPSALSSAVQLIPGWLPVTTGPLVYQAQFTGTGSEFGPPFVIGDPSASRIRLKKQAVEFEILKPGGVALIEPVMPSLPAYFGQTRISVRSSSVVNFRFGLTEGDPDRNIGSYLISVNTYAETLQLGYSLQDQAITWLSQPVPMHGLQSEREFWISALVQPPRFEIFLDNRKVIDTRHSPNVPFQVPTFGISGDAAGLVRMTALAFYELK